MTTFDITEIPVDAIVEPDSSFVDVVAYDRDDRICYIVLNGETYFYTDVPGAAYVDLINSPSVGHAYHEFSSTYGPADRLGHGYEFSIREDAPEETEAVAEDDRSLDNVLTLINSSVNEKPVEENLESYGLDEDALIRVYALESAANVFRGRKTVGKEVVKTAKIFEDYIRNAT